MIGRRLLAIATLAGLETASLACATRSEESKISHSDAVVDGVAICSASRGRCRLEAREIVKPDSRRDVGTFFTLRFDPGANERLRRDFEQTGVFYMCVIPWEPRSRRIEGRFYLHRDGGAYRPHQDSARGENETEAEVDE